MSFGHYLRSLREGAGLSRSGLARKAGVPLSTLRGWENDRGFPYMAALLRLAKALGVRVERLAEGVDDPAGEVAKATAARPRGRPPEATPATLPAKDLGAVKKGRKRKK
jgi:transcriptional regulator with XRE-family HTH domain